MGSRLQGRSTRHLESGAAAALAAVPVVALGMSEGGFYPLQWGWAAFGLGVTVVVAAVVLRREVAVSKHLLLLLGLIAAFGLWTAASLMWTRSVSLSVFELERLLLYLIGLGAAAVLVRGRTACAFVVGVFVGASAVSVWGLVSYLVTREETTDVFQGSFLHRPMGYANAMAIVSVIALLLGLGIAAESSSRLQRIAAAVGLVPASAALALTGSRAGWVALLVGAAVALAVTPDRARTVATWKWALVVPVAAALVVFATDLTNAGIVGDRADQLGERVLAALATLSALAVVLGLIATRNHPGRTRRRLPRRYGVPLAAVALAVVVVLGVRSHPDLAGDRPIFWRVALAEFSEHPALGSGAGTYGQVWLERRPIESSVHDAHSIVVETISELGPVGLLLVGLLLGAPLVWGFRARGSPLVPAATGAFAAYAAHASVDWDWEMPAVTLAGLCCAVALAVSVDGDARPVVARGAARGGVMVLGSLAAALALAVVTGASALEDASKALARGDAVSAERTARRAQRWEPWAVDPLLTQGQALLMLGRPDTARVAFVRAAARDPNDYRAWLALAAVSRGAAAQTAALRAEALNPKAVRALDPRSSGEAASLPSHINLERR